MSDSNLWNNIEDSNYSTNKELFSSHLLEQYKLYVEMADKISERRNLANVFFLTINTTIIGVIGFFFEKIKIITPTILLIFPFICFLLICSSWWWLIQSYRQLNGSKYKVIGKIESKLPIKPFFDEWKELGEGKNCRKYLPLTTIERIVPIIFGLVYLLLLIFILFFKF